MNSGRTLFAQLMSWLPLPTFRRCVHRYNGDYKVQRFSCWDQFLIMAFAQLTYRESLRDIEACLRAMGSHLYHMGIRASVSRSTLAYANDTRDWRIFADFAHSLIAKAQRLYRHHDLGLELKDSVYALDSTTIDLCLQLFPWAHFRRNKGAVKLHTLLDLRGSIPTFIHITHGKVGDVNVLDVLVAEPGAFYVMDRGYVDFRRLRLLAQSLAFYVLRSRDKLQFRRIYSHPIDKSTGLRCDQTIALTGPLTSQLYPEKLRRIVYCDPISQQHLILLTNHLTLPALTVCQLYKSRWQVELFFKWIKQHLRIKAFYGTSENAVKSQVWIAVSIYVLVAIVKKQLNLDLSLYTILQILSLTLFERRPILQVLSETQPLPAQCPMSNQLNLFHL